MKTLKQLLQEKTYPENQILDTVIKTVNEWLTQKLNEEKGIAVIDEEGNTIDIMVCINELLEELNQQ